MYNKYKPDFFLLIYLSGHIQSIILSIVWMCIKEIFEQMLTYIQGKGILQQPKKPQPMQYWKLKLQMTLMDAETYH